MIQLRNLRFVYQRLSIIATPFTTDYDYDYD